MTQNRAPIIRQTKASLYRMIKTNPSLLRRDSIMFNGMEVELPPAMLPADCVHPNKDNAIRKTHLSTKVHSTRKQGVKTNPQPPKPSALATQSRRKWTVKAKDSSQNGTVQKKKLLQPQSMSHERLEQDVNEEKNKMGNFLQTRPGCGEHPAHNASPSNHSFSANESSFAIISDFRSIATSTPYSIGKIAFERSEYYRMEHALKRWLQKRGECLDNYHRLKCFGLQQRAIEEVQEEKENIENAEQSSAYDILNLPNCHPLPMNIATGAIEDMHTLVMNGCPVEQCEQWLAYLISKSSKIDTQPQYWQCRAAIEQARGKFSEAIDCYKKSILRGANVQQVDRSLKQLFENFSNLSIGTGCAGQRTQQRSLRGAEVCNLFVSTILQCAIKERRMNEKLKSCGLANADFSR